MKHEPFSMKDEPTENEPATMSGKKQPTSISNSKKTYPQPNGKTGSSTPRAPAAKINSKQYDQINVNNSLIKNAHGHGNNSSKVHEDPSRAVKFYDDFIDFRGDILRRPPNSKNCRILWEYLFLLLQDVNYSSVIKWEDETNMVFRIVQAEKLAALWGKF